MIDLGDATLTSRRISGLSPGRYYFAMRAYKAAGTESDLSNEDSIELQECEVVVINRAMNKLIRFNALTGEIRESVLRVDKR